MKVYRVYCIEWKEVEVEVSDGYSIPYEICDSWTVDIYLSEDEAEARAERLNKGSRESGMNYYVDEWDVIE